MVSMRYSLIRQNITNPYKLTTDMEKQLFTITVFTENQVSLLHQISMVFSRRCLNIESLTVSACSIPGVHKFTITCKSEREMMEHVVKQIEKELTYYELSYILTTKSFSKKSPCIKSRQLQFSQRMRSSISYAPMVPGYWRFNRNTLFLRRPDIRMK